MNTKVKDIESKVNIYLSHVWKNTQMVVETRPLSTALSFKLCETGLARRVIKLRDKYTYFSEEDLMTDKVISFVAHAMNNSLLEALQATEESGRAKNLRNTFFSYAARWTHSVLDRHSMNWVFDMYDFFSHWLDTNKTYALWEFRNKIDSSTVRVYLSRARGVDTIHGVDSYLAHVLEGEIQRELKVCEIEDAGFFLPHFTMMDNTLYIPSHVAVNKSGEGLIEIIILEQTQNRICLVLHSALLDKEKNAEIITDSTIYTVAINDANLLGELTKSTWVGQQPPWMGYIHSDLDLFKNPNNQAAHHLMPPTHFLYWNSDVCVTFERRIYIRYEDVWVPLQDTLEGILSSPIYRGSVIHNICQQVELSLSLQE